MNAAAVSPTLSALYTIATTVAADNAPPASITVDPNVQAFPFGIPEQDSSPQFYISLDDVEGAKQDPQYVGGMTRNETFVIEGTIFGYVGDGSAASQGTLITYLFTLYGALDAAVNADPSLGGILVHSWLAGYELEPAANKAQRALRLTFTIACEAIVL